MTAQLLEREAQAAETPATYTDDAPPPPIPLRETGYAYDGASAWSSSGISWSDLANEETPELAWPNSIKVFDRMRRQDAQVSSVLRAVSSPILRTAWSLDCHGVPDEVAEFVSVNLGLPIHGADLDDGDNQTVLRGRDRFSFAQHTRLALTSLPFGHAYFEQQYRFDDAGRARLRKLAFRPQRTIAEIKPARDGGLEWIRQHPPGAWGTVVRGQGRERPIPVARLVVYVQEREGGNWLGVSLLRAAYKNWLLKDRALRAWATSVERNGMGIPIYKGAPKETNLTAGRQLARSIRGGSNAGGAIPDGAEMQIKGVDGQVVNVAEFVRYQDEQIARAVLAHFLNLGTQTGSWALGSTFADFFTLSLQTVAAEYAEVTSSHVIEDLVDINFGRDVPAPVIRFAEIGSRGNQVDDELAQIRKLAGLEDDAELARYLRENNIPAQEAA